MTIGVFLVLALAAMLGAQRGLDVHVLDRVTDGAKPALAQSLGATYHTDSVDAVTKRLAPDVVVEATGASSVVIDAMTNTAEYGIVCLTGVSPRGRTVQIDAGGLNREIVLENDATGAQTEKHQKRMMGEIAKLTAGSNGALDPAAYERTVESLLAGGSDPVITKAPEGAWTHAITDEAL